MNQKCKIKYDILYATISESSSSMLFPEFTTGGLTQEKDCKSEIIINRKMCIHSKICRRRTHLLVLTIMCETNFKTKSAVDKTRIRQNMYRLPRIRLCLEFNAAAVISFIFKIGK